MYRFSRYLTSQEDKEINKNEAETEKNGEVVIKVTNKVEAQA